VLPGHFQTVFHDKSGYQHVKLAAASRTYFGFQWGNWYFVFCVLCSPVWLESKCLHIPHTGPCSH
jgi:hypothetical protein